jgi:hypothetical protein
MNFFKLRNLFLKEISMDRLNGLADDMNSSNKRVTFADTNNSVEYLKVEIHHREDIISSLQQELKVLRNQYESLLYGVRLCFLAVVKS